MEGVNQTANSCLSSTERMNCKKEDNIQLTSLPDGANIPDWCEPGKFQPAALKASCLPLFVRKSLQNR